MKSTTNVFLDGIITDQNPLTMPETALTSALNATIITGNGNEGLLLNDMGNTLIKDSITGNIMSLSNGFIPLGMKERGGILYIASYNPQTKEGELGTIPSPVISYTYNENKAYEEDTHSLTISDIKSTDSNEETSVDERLYKSQIYVLSNHVFHGGDKFIVILNLNLEKDKSLEENDAVTYKQIISNSTNPSTIEINFPQITNDEYRGWFKIKLFALGINGEDPKELTSITNTSQEYYTTGGKKTSGYWFINSNDIEGDFNLNRTRTSGLFRTFPNIQSGRLAIQFEVEKPEHLEYLYNTQYNKNLPQLIALRTAEEFDYYVAVHGFKYNGLCAILPDKIKVKCNLPIYKSSSYNGGYIIDDSTSYTEITIYPSPNPNLGAKNNNSQSLQTNFLGLDPAAIGEAYLSNISNNEFIISRYRHPNNILFSNYSSNLDALFFIKLDAFDQDIEVSVDLYTKDFSKDPSSADEYVKYDSYALPTFNPLIESGQGDIDKKTVRLRLVIQNPEDDEYDVELFGGELEEGKNKCFVCSVGDDENGVILEYNKQERKYKPKKKLKDNAFNSDFTDFSNEYKHNKQDCLLDEDVTISEFSLVKSWIYPITKLHTSPGASALYPASSLYDNYFFLYGGDSYRYTRQYFVRDDENPNPTYCLPSLPKITYTIDDETIDQPCLFPVCYDDSTTVQDTYERAAECKYKAKKFINEYGLTATNLKEYCLFNTNLYFLNKEFDTEYNVPVEPMFDNKGGELHIWDNYNKTVIASKYLPALFDRTINRVISLTDNKISYDIINNRTNFKHDYPFWTESEGIYRQYTISTFAATDLFMSSDTSFIYFLVATTPGFIRADGKTRTLLDMLLLNNAYPQQYLYKTPILCCFINKGYSAITTNYLTPSRPTGHPFGWSQYGYLWADAKNIIFSEADDGATQQLGEFNVRYNFTTYLNYSNPLSDLIKEYKGESNPAEYKITYDSTDVLGIGSIPLEVSIPLNDNKCNIKTTCSIKAQHDGVTKLREIDFYPPENFDDNAYKAPFDYTWTYGVKHYVGRLDWWGWDEVLNILLNSDKMLEVSAMSWMTRYAEVMNILTTSRAQLFIDKSISNLTYKNKSDYSLDYLISLKNNFGIEILTGNIPTQSISNIELDNNLLAAHSIEDSETIEDLNISEITPLVGQQDLESAADIINNSFVDEQGYLPTNVAGNKINIKFGEITLQKGWYIFNINYNYTSDSSNDSEFYILFSINGSMLSLTGIKNNQHLIAIYIPSEETVAPAFVIHNLCDKIIYIKNCGLYKVNDGVISNTSGNIEYVTSDNDPDLILSKIILPGVFCFKELYADGETLGCENETYGGFLALPDRSYQLVVGVYALSNTPDGNGNYIYADFIDDSIPLEFQDKEDLKERLLSYIQNNIIKNGLEIRHLL